MIGPRSTCAGFRRLAATARAKALPVRMLLSNDAGSGIEDAAIRRMVPAFAALLGVVAAEYDLLRPLVEFLPHGAQRVPVQGYIDAWLHIVATITDDPADEGWHSLGADGLPDGFISTEGLDLDGLSEVIFHEIAETEVNPNLDQVVVLPDGSTWPLEVCDAVQARDNAERVAVFVGGPPVMCANFVTRAYWDPATPRDQRVDFLALLPGPIPALATSGYSAVTGDDGVVRDVFGEQRMELPAGKEDPRSRYQACRAALADAVLAVPVG